MRIQCPHPRKRVTTNPGAPLSLIAGAWVLRAGVDRAAVQGGDRSPRVAAIRPVPSGWSGSRATTSS